LQAVETVAGADVVFAGQPIEESQIAPAGAPPAAGAAGVGTVLGCVRLPFAKTPLLPPPPPLLLEVTTLALAMAETRRGVVERRRFEKPTTTLVSFALP